MLNVKRRRGPGAPAVLPIGSSCRSLVRAGRSFDFFCSRSDAMPVTIDLTRLPLALSAGLIAIALAGLAGCGSGSGETPKSAGPKPTANDGHAHDHGAGDRPAPHGGHIIELGRNHQYHAELVEDEKAHSVTVYILDKDMKELPIDQRSVVVNLVVDGKAQTFELTAAGAQEGKASRFVSSGKALFEALHEHEATGKLRVTINGSPYSGEIAHDHDHDHDHDDHDHDGKEHKHDHKHKH